MTSQTPDQVAAEIQNLKNITAAKERNIADQNALAAKQAAELTFLNEQKRQAEEALKKVAAQEKPG